MIVVAKPKLIQSKASQEDRGVGNKMLLQYLSCFLHGLCHEQAGLQNHSAFKARINELRKHVYDHN